MCFRRFSILTNIVSLKAKVNGLVAAFALKYVIVDSRGELKRYVETVGAVLNKQEAGWLPWQSECSREEYLSLASSQSLY
jgi:hypothetical protein